jgi:two-component system, OmpR family, alkaline phosphatase synthesis response regulator PhoP
VTARVEEADRIAGLEVGADDYVTKPFSPRELVARVKAVLRRGDISASRGDVFTVSDLTFDMPRLRLTRRSQTIDLTSTEFQLLATLARLPGRVFTRAQLLDAIHGLEVDAFERAIDTHIKNIRRKIEPDTRNPIYVLTVYGIGYRFADA